MEQSEMRVRARTMAPDCASLHPGYKSVTNYRRRTPTMPSGLRKGLTSYGDPGFSLFLRKAFIKAKGFSDDALDRPIIGVTDTYSDFNPCHGNVPQLIQAVKRGHMVVGRVPCEVRASLTHRAFPS